MDNIINTLQPVTGISHPLVSDMYLKKNSTAQNNTVLVIETRGQKESGIESNHHDSDSCLMDLLIDLEDLKNRAEKKVGRFDRIDIRTS